MKIRCPDYVSGVCTEGCMGYLENPREDGRDANLNSTYTAICTKCGRLQYFYGLYPDANSKEMSVAETMIATEPLSRATADRIVPDIVDAVKTALAPVVSQFDPNDRFAGLNKITSITRQTQIRRAIEYSWDENYAIVRPKVGANDKTTKGKNTIASLARVVWERYCEKEKWDSTQFSCVGYPNLKAYEVALRDRAEDNPASFRWVD